MNGKKKEGNSWSWRRVRLREREASLHVDRKLAVLKTGSDAGDRADTNKKLLRR